MKILIVFHYFWPESFRINVLALGLQERGHEVTVLARKGSETKLQDVARCVVGDPLRFDSYTERVRPADTFVHLVGVSYVLSF